jgi:hypothetical protein
VDNSVVEGIAVAGDEVRTGIDPAAGRARTRRGPPSAPRTISPLASHPLGALLDALDFLVLLGLPQSA